jgi:hypothetical protein
MKYVIKLTFVCFFGFPAGGSGVSLNVFMGHPVANIEISFLYVVS